MKSQIFATILGTALLSTSVLAGLPEAIQSFDRGDYKGAFAEFSYLSEEGNPTAFYYLGRMYNDGLGVEQNATRAIEMFKIADQGFNLSASVELGKKMITGDGVAQDTEAGIQFLKKAAYAGNTDALMELGNLYEDGTGVEKNYTYAFGFYYMAALKGDKRAQMMLGRYYLNGRGIPQDDANALKWYGRAVNQGYIQAQQEWAELRATHPRLKNPVDAYAWYSILAAYDSTDVGKEAAQKRDMILAKAKNNILKELRLQQKRVQEWRPVSPEKSVPEVEKKSAIMPIIPGFNDTETLQNMLKSGDVILSDGDTFGITTNMIDTALLSQDRTTLEQQVENAVKKEQVGAYAYYGDLLHSRFNDDTAAVTWYQKGADKGDYYAQYRLAKSYCEGVGVETPNASLCYGWMLLAAETTDIHLKTTVQNALLSIEAEATDEEKTAGQTFAQQYRQKQTVLDTADKKDSGFFNLF